MNPLTLTCTYCAHPLHGNAACSKTITRAAKIDRWVPRKPTEKTTVETVACPCVRRSPAPEGTP